MKIQRLLAAALAAALSLGAIAQTILAPADSRDSAARARVAITPVDTSQFATTTQLNGVASTANAAYNTANSAYWYGTTAYDNANYAVGLANNAQNTANTANYYGYAAYTNTSGNFSQPWGRYFPGWQKSAISNGHTMYVNIDGNGYFRFNRSGGGWQGWGYSGGSQCMTFNPISPSGWYPGGTDTITACPVNFDYYGRPADWTVTYYYTP